MAQGIGSYQCIKPLNLQNVIQVLERTPRRGVLPLTGPIYSSPLPPCAGHPAGASAAISPLAALNRSAGSGRGSLIFSLSGPSMA